MAVNLETTVENLNDNLVQEMEYLLKAFVEIDKPTVDVTKGSAFYDLVIRISAIFQTINYVNVNRWRRGTSLLEISKLPDAVDPAMVDAVLSNFRITRKTGQKASGTATIFLNSNATTAIPSGTRFTSSELGFVTQQAYIGVPTQDLVTRETDRLIVAAGNGVYSFNIEVIAEQEGSQYQLTQGTALAIQTPPSNYAYTRAAYDFSQGASAETNLEMLKRLESGISGKTLASRRHIRALIQEQFPNVLHGSVIGFGNPEMQRDRGDIFKISFGGKSDIYVQSSSRPMGESFRKSAILVNPAEQKWQISLDRDEFAGVYKIASIKPAGSSDDGSLSIVQETRDINSSPVVDRDGSTTPEIANYAQGAFSRFQTLVVEFIDDQFDASGLPAFTTTRDYDLVLLKMPDIAAIQDSVVSDFWMCSHRYDDLVRAPIPVLTSIGLGVRTPMGTEVNIQAVQLAIADRVNNLGFTDRLSASVILDAVQGIIDPDAQVTMPIDMLGELIDPSTGSSIIYRSANTLRIPVDYEKSISEDTLMFFVDPNDVDVWVENF